MRSTSLIAGPATALALILAAGCGGPADTGEDYAERMAKEHATDTPVASPAAEAEPAAAVESQRVIYANVDGRHVSGYLARPAGAAEGSAIPGMIVIHEWWGLNDNVEAMARQLAGEGYLALAVDLYGGEVAADRDAARALMTATMENPAAAEENLSQAYAYLEAEGAPRVGSIGWCFGGGWSLKTALLLPGELDAAVIYYGQPVTDRDRLATLTAPVLGLFGADDQGIPVATVNELEAALTELGKSVEIHVYEGAGHAFANPSGTRYNAEAAADAWQKTLAFLRLHLQG